MTRERIGQLVFVVAAAVAAALYALTVPEGLPWNASTHWALAYLGEIARLPRMPHPVWGRFVEVFGSPIALACFCAAAAAGLLGAVVNRHFGWRFAASAAIVWIWMPGVWSRAITGERSVCLWALVVAAAWAANAAGLWVYGKAQALMAASGGALAGRALSGVAHEVHEKYVRINRLAGWVALGAAGIFAVVSMTFHDYCLGEAASVFARGVVAEAGDRIIVANGLVDDQIGEEVPSAWCLVPGVPDAPSTKHEAPSTIFLRNDVAYRRMLVEWVKREWPNETNLWVAAEVSPTAFVQAAERKHPERFYLMNGASTTAEGWEKRWADFEPYLKSSDRFVAVAKLAFAQEGAAVARRLELAGDRKGAKRIREKVRSKSEEGRSKREEVRSKREEGRSKSEDGKSGVVKVERIGRGQERMLNREDLSLVDWSNEMVASMDRHEMDRAGRIARVILSNPAWSGFIPANAVMGAVAASEGDYLASAAFFRVAVSTTNAVPAITFNDYADTLMRLGRLEEAEAMARRAVAVSDEAFWIARLTLAQVLQARYRRTDRVVVVENGEKVERYVKPAGAEKAEAEIAELMKTIDRQAPKDVRKKVRKRLGRVR